jgi:acetoin utilization deacetylase AcuC-like enzyme
MRDLIFFYPDEHEKHASPNHPERPERVEAIRTILAEAGYWTERALIPPETVSRELLEAVHTSAHLERLEAASARRGQIDADTYITLDSWRLALQAAGGAVAVARAVWEREAKRGFALCRPPGHHATREHAMGFCLLNNIAIAAEYLLREKYAERVAIVDIDLHHGNGTQDIFYERENVFFCSVHQYPLYPMSGMAQESGSGPGAMTNLNIPFPPYAGDQARQTAWETVIKPALVDFRPEMLLVSAGFDAHWRDPLGHQLATADGYGWLAAAMADFAGHTCQGRLAVFLEGGYDLEGGSASALAMVQALAGEEWKDRIGPSPMAEDPFWQTRLMAVIDHWSEIIDRRAA